MLHPPQFWKLLSDFLVLKGDTDLRLFDGEAHYITISSFYALSIIQYKMKFHTHQRYEIMYVTKGSCCVSINSTDYHLSAHEFIFIAKNVSHNLTVHKNSPCSILNIEFDFQNQASSIPLDHLLTASDSFRSFFNSSYTDYIIGTDSYDLGCAFKDLLLHLEKRSSLMDMKKKCDVDLKDNIALIRLGFFRVLIELSRCIMSNNNRPSGILYTRKACNYIDEHLADTLHISEIADFVGISRSYLCALFTQYHNCTINDYINSHRIEKAKFLLKSSNLSVTDIAFFCGYNSRQHFRSTFCKYVEMNPKEYRFLKQNSVNVSTGGSKKTVDSSGIKTTDMEAEYKVISI